MKIVIILTVALLCINSCKEKCYIIKKNNNTCIVTNDNLPYYFVRKITKGINDECFIIEIEKNDTVYYILSQKYNTLKKRLCNCEIKENHSYRFELYRFNTFQDNYSSSLEITLMFCSMKLYLDKQYYISKNLNGICILY